jgi:ATP-dependent Lhr-like helicase
VLAALELLQGEDFPVRVWEQDLLSARVEDYQREWVDRLGLSGEIVWTVFTAGERAATPRVGVALRENVGWLRDRPAVPPTVDDATKNVLLHLQLRGASFARELARGSGLDESRTLAALWDLFRAGLVTPDTFSAILAGAAAPSPTAGPAARRRRLGQTRGPITAVPVVGRWSALPDDEPIAADERDEARARLLLARYGIVAREVARGEWSRLRHALARLEYAGEILRGYFVDGLSGEQYALEDAADDLLRGGRRAEPHVVVNALDPATTASAPRFPVVPPPASCSARAAPCSR